MYSFINVPPTSVVQSSFGQFKQYNEPVQQLNLSISQPVELESQRSLTLKNKHLSQETELLKSQLAVVQSQIRCIQQSPEAKLQINVQASRLVSLQKQVENLTLLVAEKDYITTQLRQKVHEAQFLQKQFDVQKVELSQQQLTMQQMNHQIIAQAGEIGQHRTNERKMKEYNQKAQEVVSQLKEEYSKSVKSQIELKESRDILIESMKLLEARCAQLEEQLAGKDDELDKMQAECEQSIQVQNVAQMQFQEKSSLIQQSQQQQVAALQQQLTFYEKQYQGSQNIISEIQKEYSPIMKSEIAASLRLDPEAELSQSQVEKSKQTQEIVKLNELVQQLRQQIQVYQTAKVCQTVDLALKSEVEKLKRKNEQLEKQVETFRQNDTVTDLLQQVDEQQKVINEQKLVIEQSGKPKEQDSQSIDDSQLKRIQELQELNASLQDQVASLEAKDFQAEQKDIQMQQLQDEVNRLKEGKDSNCVIASMENHQQHEQDLELINGLHKQLHSKNDEVTNLQTVQKQNEELIQLLSQELEIQKHTAVESDHQKDSSILLDSNLQSNQLSQLQLKVVELDKVIADQRYQIERFQAIVQVLQKQTKPISTQTTILSQIIRQLKSQVQFIKTDSFKQFQQQLSEKSEMIDNLQINQKVQEVNSLIVSFKKIIEDQNLLREGQEQMLSFETENISKQLSELQLMSQVLRSDIQSIQSLKEPEEGKLLTRTSISTRSQNKIRRANTRHPPQINLDIQLFVQNNQICEVSDNFPKLMKLKSILKEFNKLLLPLANQICDVSISIQQFCDHIFTGDIILELLQKCGQLSGYELAALQEAMVQEDEEVFLECGINYLLMNWDKTVQQYLVDVVGRESTKYASALKKFESKVTEVVSNTVFDTVQDNQHNFINLLVCFRLLSYRTNDKIYQLCQSQPVICTKQMSSVLTGVHEEDNICVLLLPLQNKEGEVIKMQATKV